MAEEGGQGEEGAKEGPRSVQKAAVSRAREGSSSQLGGGGGSGGSGSGGSGGSGGDWQGGFVAPPPALSPAPHQPQVRVFGASFPRPC